MGLSTVSIYVVPQVANLIMFLKSTVILHPALNTILILDVCEWVQGAVWCYDIKLSSITPSQYAKLGLITPFLFNQLYTEEELYADHFFWVIVVKEQNR
eukprot:m.277653 g.277653  ORF g.277653 m.277653 type:complete len:99 (-) comp19784_c0_seq3:1542-1838(-)